MTVVVLGRDMLALLLLLLAKGMFILHKLFSSRQVHLQSYVVYYLLGDSPRQGHVMYVGGFSSI
jgi:hypothetical protein